MNASPKIVRYSPTACGIQLGNEIELYFSYDTLVGARVKDLCFRSDYISRTTSKHLRLFGIEDWPKYEGPGILEDWTAKNVTVIA
jgi:hypothetical protein